MSREFDFIDWLRRQQRPTEQVLLPAGDDLAILRVPAGDLVLIGIDQILDGVHFDARTHSPDLIGRKAMNRNLSDCAAMACLPVAAVVSVALPRGTPIDFAQALYLGMKAAGDAFGCEIVGGDTGAWDQRLAISVSILGRTAGVEPVRRGGAKPGDAVYVTGPLGGSILGRHLSFTPRVREARDLVARHRISAMIDISDGLSRDLSHICTESRVGAQLDAAAIPIHADVARLTDGLSPLEHALNDGEDHELCFTGEPGISSAIRVGTIVDAPGLWVDRDGRSLPLKAGAFEHQF